MSTRSSRGCSRLRGQVPLGRRTDAGQGVGSARVPAVLPARPGDRRSSPHATDSTDSTARPTRPLEALINQRFGHPQEYVTAVSPLLAFQLIRPCWKSDARPSGTAYSAVTG